MSQQATGLGLRKVNHCYAALRNTNSIRACLAWLSETRAEAETAAQVAVRFGQAEGIFHRFAIQRPKGAAMRTFTIDAEDNIAAFASAEEVGQKVGLERFNSIEQLEALARRWPVSRLAGIWNKLPGGVQPLKKFTDRKTGLARIWKALQGSQPAAVASKPKGGKQAAGKQGRRHTGHKNTKATQVIALLKQPSGASLKSLMKATGWQAHSVRGFLSGHLHRKLGLRVKSFKRNGERVYTIRA